MSSTQPQTHTLSQCRKCTEKGFKDIMIYFIQNGVNKTTGKPFWDLKNPDGTVHNHITSTNPTITTTVQPTAPTNKVPAVTEQKTSPVTNGTTKEQQIQALHDENTMLHKESITINRDIVKALQALTDVLWELVRSKG